MFSIVVKSPLTCDQCKTTFAELDQDSCATCIPRLGAKLSEKPGYRTALAIMANHNAAMSTQLDQANFHKVYTFFSRGKDDCLLILPNTKSVSTGLRRYLATLSAERRAEHFWSHCFALQGNDPTSGQLISVKGNVVNVVAGPDGPVAVEHMGQRFAITSFYQSENGNYCYFVSGILYPYLLLNYSNPLFLWHPFLYLFNLVECSNFLTVFRDSGLFDGYTENCRETYSLLLPRNDTFTKQCVEFLADPSDKERFVKNHIIKGYLLPATEETGESLETLGPAETIVTEFGTELFFQTVLNASGKTQKALMPIKGILAKARIIQTFTLARGTVVIIDRPLDEFPDELTIVSSSQ